MGLQLECPLCGMARTPDKFGFRRRGLKAKEVRSLGGNDGFEHVEVSTPRWLRRRMELYISVMYRALVEGRPRPPVTVEPSQTKVTFPDVNTNVKFEPN